MSQPRQDRAHLFLSYARDDLASINPLVERLGRDGYRLWYDQAAIQAGSEWRRQIVDAIESCDVVIVALSNRSVTSASVRRELDIAEASGKLIVPIQISQVQVPASLKYHLAGIQMIEFRENATRSFEQLVKVLAERFPVVGESERPAVAPGTLGVNDVRIVLGVLPSQLHQSAVVEIRLLGIMSHFRLPQGARNGDLVRFRRAFQSGGDLYAKLHVVDHFAHTVSDPGFSRAMTKGDDPT